MKKILIILLALPFNAMAAEFTCEAVYSKDGYSNHFQESVQADSLSESSQTCARKVVSEIKSNHLEMFLDAQNKATCTLVLDGSYIGHSLIDQMLSWKSSADSKKFTYQSSLQECLAQALNQVEDGYKYSRRYGRVKSSFNVDVEAIHFSAELYARNYNEKPVSLQLSVFAD